MIKNEDARAYVSILSKVEDIGESFTNLSEGDFYRTRNLKILSDYLQLFRSCTIENIADRNAMTKCNVKLIVKKELSNLRIVRNLLYKMTEKEVIDYLKQEEDNYKNDIIRKVKLGAKKAQEKRNRNFAIQQEAKRLEKTINDYFYKMFTDKTVSQLADMCLLNIGRADFEQILRLLFEEIQKITNIKLTKAEKGLLGTQIKVTIYKKRNKQ